MNNSIIIIAIFLVISGCQENTVDQKTEGEHLMNISREWAKSKTPEETLSYWADDAIVMAPGQPSLKGKDAIKKMIEGSAGIPGFEVNWEPKEVYVSKSGDLAYLIEQNYFAMNDSLGNQQKTFNKVVTIWKKQEDGTWKNVVDMWNEDPSIKSLE